MQAHAPRLLVALCLQLFVLVALAQGDERKARPSAPAPQAPSGEPRVALVIGNNTYAGAPLRNPVNDARDMADALKAAGFQVSLRENIGLRGLAEALRSFGDAMQPGGIAVFYYAGHGVQVRDRNYLLPVDADIQREDEIPYSSLDVNLVLDKMDRARSRVNIVILDACRNNPFARSFRGLGQGLAQMEAPVGTLIAYATAPGKVALDGDGRNGIYTRHLLANIARPGLPIELMFKRVREGVTAETKGVQTPWESSSLRGEFAFMAPAAVAPPTGAVAGAGAGTPARSEAFEAELAFWESIKSSRIKADYEAYLEQFPKGHFAPLARARIAQLAADAAAAAAKMAKAQPPPAAAPSAAAGGPAAPSQPPATEPKPANADKAPAKDARVAPSQRPAESPPAAPAKAPPTAPAKATAELRYFSAPAKSGAVPFNLGDRFTGPGVVTIGRIGAKKQIVVPAGEWVVLAAVDRDSGHGTPSQLTQFILGKFAGDHLASAIRWTATRAPSNVLNWSDLDDCERNDGARLYQWKSGAPYRRHCALIAFSGATPTLDFGEAGQDFRQSLARMGAKTAGPALHTLLVFADKVHGFVRIDRTDWPAGALGNDVGGAQAWTPSLLGASTPRAAYAKGLIAWTEAYRAAAEEGLRRNIRDADLVAGAAAPANSSLSGVGDFDPAKVLATR